MPITIVVTEKEYCKAEQYFKSAHDLKFIPAPSEENRLSAIISEKSAFGCILGVDPYKGMLYKALAKGGIIARFGVGHDGIDKLLATENGIIVTNTPRVLDDSVAEHTVFLMGVLARGIYRHNFNIKNKKWMPELGNELRGKNLLILGCGSIGRKVAKIASFGFGMNVTGCDISDMDAGYLRKYFGITRFIKDYNLAIGQADIISIHLPSLPATRHIINKEFLSKLKNSTYVINTSRGPIADETAIYDALKENKIAAALDVFENEPFEPVDKQKDLRDLKNAILTPHIGSSTIEACQRMALSCLKNIDATYNRQYEKLDILNPTVLEKLR